MIKKYRKKPVVVEAMQITSDNGAEILEWANKGVKAGFSNVSQVCDTFWVYTNHGRLDAYEPDYIIKSQFGEFYPCGDNNFVATYDLVEETK